MQVLQYNLRSILQDNTFHAVAGLRCTVNRRYPRLGGSDDRRSFTSGACVKLGTLYSSDSGTSPSRAAQILVEQRRRGIDWNEHSKNDHQGTTFADYIRPKETKFVPPITEPRRRLKYFFGDLVNIVQNARGKRELKRDFGKNWQEELMRRSLIIYKVLNETRAGAPLNRLHSVSNNLNVVHQAKSESRRKWTLHEVIKQDIQCIRKQSADSNPGQPLSTQVAIRFITVQSLQSLDPIRQKLKNATRAQEQRNLVTEFLVFERESTDKNWLLVDKIEPMDSMEHMEELQEHSKNIMKELAKRKNMS